MKENMRSVLIQWLSSVNVDDEIRKILCRPTKCKRKLAQAKEERIKGRNRRGNHG
jgi:hypothetical protein